MKLNETVRLEHLCVRRSSLCINTCMVREQLNIVGTLLVEEKKISKNTL